jgi:uncharacterized protein YdeI (YjbR/CyaY-like superfamily)
MAEDLYVHNGHDWREWLSRNHDKSKEVWLVYYKKQTGKPSVSYDDSVEEALCFGWVDSIIRKIDDEKYARKFTPRKIKTRWSTANKKRVEKMIREGKMTEAGLARIEEAKAYGEWHKIRVSGLHGKKLVIPPYFAAALQTNKKALAYFDKLANSYKRNFILWIDSAKKEETRKKRIAEAIGLLERNRKLGMK